jgi:hypothetical protein
MGWPEKMSTDGEPLKAHKFVENSQTGEEYSPTVVKSQWQSKFSKRNISVRLFSIPVVFLSHYDVSRKGSWSMY